jgi:RimJ/RimL family protein N-acetyltransferase
MILRLRGRDPGRVLARGRRVTLREFTRADVDQWHDWPRHTDPLFYVFDPPARSPGQRDGYYARERRLPGVRQFAVDGEDRRLIGRIRLREIDWFARTAVLGISFRPDILGQGLGTEALQLFLAEYFGTMRMAAIFLDVAAHNLRARRCYERCGFRPIGEHWSELLPDLAGIFRNPAYSSIRRYFRAERGQIRELLIDMALHRNDFGAAYKQGG